MEHVRTAATTAMAASSKARQLKEKRHKVARTLLKPEPGPAKPPAKRKHLVDGKLVDLLPFNANGNPTSSRPVVIAKTVLVGSN